MTITSELKEAGGKQVEIIRLSGRFTLAYSEDANRLRSRINQDLSGGILYFALEFRNVPYVDSSGIGTLISMFRTVSNNGGRIVFFSISERVMQLLQITKLYSVFDFYADEQEALRSFAQ